MAPNDLPSHSTGVFAHGRSRVTRELLGRGEVAELLDYGCGRAEFAIAAASELALTVHACDIDAGLIDRLRSSHGQHVNFFVISEERPELPFDERQLSAVSCCDVLEHMSPALRDTVLKELRRVLADDGALVVTTPHKGLFSAIDPENVKHRFPRIHRFVYRRVKGPEKYRERYEGERFGNYSSGSTRHVHFSLRELSQTLGRAGFEVDEISYYGLLAPLIQPLLWLSESLAGRVPGFRPLSRLCWRLYIRDTDLNAGRLASGIAIRARKAALTSPRARYAHATAEL